MEHHSNIGPRVMACQETGATLRVVPITSSGDLDVGRLEEMLNERTKILAVSHVSNVTGAISAVKRITAMAHAKGVKVLVDGAQAVPHFPVDVRDRASGSFTAEPTCWTPCRSPIRARPCRRT
jgi:cysteine desulfurase/selenocysteine lyase